SVRGSPSRGEPSVLAILSFIGAESVLRIECVRDGRVHVCIRGSADLRAQVPRAGKGYRLQRGPCGAGGQKPCRIGCSSEEAAGDRGIVVGCGDTDKRYRGRGFWRLAGGSTA